MRKTFSADTLFIKSIVEEINLKNIELDFRKNH